MKRLIKGYEQFRLGFFADNAKRYAELARSGQKPHALVITCCDSRVGPERIFDADPGEIFMIRNVANLVPPYAPTADYHGTSAAIEFAVRVLEVELLVVLGHSMCGGVQALIGDGAADRYDFLGHWMKLADPVRERIDHCGYSREALQFEAELAVIQLSLENLMTFPWIAERVASGTLSLYGCHFDIATGDLKLLAPGGDRFSTVPPTAPAAQQQD